MTHLFAKLYLILARHRLGLFVTTLLVIALSGLNFSQLEMKEDITSMLPDNEAGILEDYQLFQMAPFANKIMISLKRPHSMALEELINISDKVAAHMDPTYFTRVMTGPGKGPNENFFDWVWTLSPRLMAEEDLQAIDKLLNPKDVSQRLHQCLQQLQSPEAMALKKTIQTDPLALRNQTLKKLSSLLMVPKMRPKNNHFVSADENYVMLIAETDISGTDSGKGEALVMSLENTLKEAVPPEVMVAYISGHRYSVVNSTTIKNDLSVILTVSTLCIFLLFFYFLKSLRSIFVFLIPASVVCLAASALPLFFDSVSRITIGFGAVVLGITIDFALHVYFALREEKDKPEEIMSRVARPVIFCGFTTVGSLAILLTSDLPGQRQMSVFAVTGISASLLLALTVLPHLIPPANHKKKLPSLSFIKTQPPKKLLMTAWLIVMAFCILQFKHLKFDGELKNLGMVSQEIIDDEKAIAHAWGNFRKRALIFARGKNLEEALQRNDTLYQELCQVFGKSKVVSLSPFMPSLARQEEQQQLWETFWDKRRQNTARELIEGQAEKTGFSKNAFEPFFVSLNRQPPAITEKQLQEIGFGELVESMVITKNGETLVLSTVPDDSEAHLKLTAIEKKLPHIHYVSGSHFGDNISAAIDKDFNRFLFLAGLLIILLLIFLFRNTQKILLALLPVASGLIFMFGMMGFLGLPLNLFNVVAIILVMGLTVDYGIFMTCYTLEKQSASTAAAVFVSGLTTLAGFGTLALGQHPSLYSIGLTVLLGIGAAIPTALWVIPALAKRKI